MIFFSVGEPCYNMPRRECRKWSDKARTEDEKLVTRDENSLKKWHFSKTALSFSVYSI